MPENTEQNQQEKSKTAENTETKPEVRIKTSSLIAKALEARRKDIPFDLDKAKQEITEQQQSAKKEKHQDEEQIDLKKLTETEEETQSTETEEKQQEQQSDENVEDDHDYKKSHWEDVSPDDFVRKDGRAISDHTKLTVTEAFTGIKRHLSDANRELFKLRKKTPKLEEENKKLRDQLKELKQWRDERYFEESPDFKDSFVTPVIEQENKIKTYVESIGIEPGTTAESEIKRGLSFLHKYANEGDETKFTLYVDKVLEQFPNSPTLKAKFVNATDAYFSSTTKRNNALKNKEEARKEILKKDAEVVSTSRAAVEEVLKAQLSEFEEKNSQFVEFFRSDKAKDFFKYDETVEQGRKKASDLLTEAFTSRRPSKELLALVTRGILGEISDKEKQSLAKQSEVLQTQIDNLKKELAKSRGVLDKLKPSPSRPSSSGDGGKKKSFTSRLAEVYSK